MLRLKMNEVPMGRRCGRCTMCCTWIGVTELGKPAGVPCQHLTPDGCGIYDTRPESCRKFECAWKLGLGDATVRPDRLGGVVTSWRHGLAVYGPNRRLDERAAFVRRLVDREVREGRTVVFIAGQDVPRRVVTAEGSGFDRLQKEINATHGGDK